MPDLKTMIDETEREMADLERLDDGDDNAIEDVPDALDADEGSDEDATVIETLGLKLTRLSDGKSRLCVVRDGDDAQPESCIESDSETADELLDLLKRNGLLEE